MREGLAGTMMHALIENLYMLERMNNRDQLLRNEIYQALCAAISRPELAGEIRQRLKSTKIEERPLVDTLMYNLLKVQNFISNEKIAILDNLGKNYPDLMTAQWFKVEKGYQFPKIQNFFNQTLQKMERKKTNMILKIIEDWLKNYQVLSSVDSNEEKVLQSERDEILKKDALILA